jgi:hypothetical protein
MLDLHIDDCHRALRRFAAAAAADHDTPGGPGGGGGDPEWRGRLEALGGRLQEMADYLVADRALLLRMPALVAQQAANRPAGSAPEIAGLFALERGQAGAGHQSQRAREAEAANSAGRQALARYRPPPAPARESADSARASLAQQQSEACDAPLGATVGAAAVCVENGAPVVAGASVGTGSDSGVIDKGGDSESTAEASPSESTAELVGPCAEVITAAAIESGVQTTDGHLIATEVGHGEMLPPAEGNTLSEGDRAAVPLDPAPPWIEHVNKEELAAAVRRRERAGGVASSGAVSCIPRASFGHVALSSDEVHCVPDSHVACAVPCCIRRAFLLPVAACLADTIPAAFNTG